MGGMAGPGAFLGTFGAADAADSDRRRKGTSKRPAWGGPRVNHSIAIDFDAMPHMDSDRGRELIALDDALEALAKFDLRKAHVIELRFFGGLSVEETAHS